MVLLIVLFACSILFNIVVIIYDFGPFYTPKIRRKLRPGRSLNRHWDKQEHILADASVQAMKRRKPLMVWHDPRGIAEQLFDLKHHTSRASFRMFNYPRAFLLYGICEYAITTGNTNLLNSLKGEFDKYLNIEGKPTFTLDKVDQSNFGIVAIRLYGKFKEQKYYEFARVIFEDLLKNYDANKTFLLYRQGQNVWLNDVLGLTVPFLMEYYKLTGNEASMLIAKQQMQHFIERGIDEKTFVPAHGIDLTTRLKVGSINWGRGIGWFFIALKALYEFDGSFKTEYFGLTETLLAATNGEGLWSQFPGSSDYFDASTTTMFLYCLPAEEYNLSEMLKKLDKYVTKDGFIKQTSGDTYGANSYSRTFGKSEFSQGMMLLLLSKHKKYNEDKASYTDT